MSNLKSTRLYLLLLLINLRFFLVNFYKIQSGFLSWFILLLTLIAVGKKDWNIKKYATILLFLILYVLNPLAKEALLVIVSIWAFRQMPIKKFAAFNLLICSVFLVWAWYLVYLGEIKENYYLKSFDTSFECGDLGFGNPNFFAGYIFYMIICIYLLLSRKTLILFFVVISIALWTYSYSGSRTFLIAEIMLLFVHFIYKCKWFNWKYLIAFQIVATFFIVFFFGYNYDPIIDIILSGRLMYYNAILQEMGGREFLFGFDFSALNEDIILDNSYIALFVFGGIPYFLFFMFSVYKSLVLNFDLIRPYIPAISAILFAGIGESSFIAFGTASVLILWLLFRTNTVKPLKYQKNKI